LREPGNRVKAWTAGKSAVNGLESYVTARRWITARELDVFSEEARDLQRGEPSEGRNESQERLWHETRPQNSSLLGNR
jgi:hypothetical protein